MKEHSFKVNILLGIKRNIYAFLIVLTASILQETLLFHPPGMDSPSSRYLILNIFTFLLLCCARELALTVAMSKFSLTVFGLLFALFLEEPYILGSLPGSLWSLILEEWFAAFAYLCTWLMPFVYFVFVCYVKIKDKKGVFAIISSDRLLFLLFVITSVVTAKLL